MSELNIAFIADKNFFLPSMVALTSLLENRSKEVQYHVYFVVVEFSSEQKRILEEFGREKQVSLEIVEIKEQDLLDKYKEIVKHKCCASVSALIKFDLPYICRQVDKLLYLDGDIIVKTDLSELTKVNMGLQDYAAVVEDSGMLYSETLIRQNIEHYFNSGVMLLNLEALRNNKIPELLIEEKFKDQDNSLMDQHILNKVFQGHIKILPHKYNVLYMNLIRAQYFHSITVEDVNLKFKMNYADWNEMFDRAAIIHYSSYDKPWKYSDVTGVELWNYYYRISPLKSQSLNRKKLHIPLLNRMLEIKGLALLASFIWECETKGIRLAIEDSFHFISRLNKKLKIMKSNFVK